MAQRVPKRPFRTVEIEVIEPPPPVAVPEQQPEPKQKKPPPKPAKKPKLPKIKPKEIDLTKLKPPAKEDIAPPSNTDTTPEEEPKEPPKPIFGISMSSVVGAGAGDGFQLRVGNTLMKEREKTLTAPEEVNAYHKPIPLHQVTKMPRVVDECRGVYPDKARSMGIEGEVKLAVQVLQDGSVGEVTVVNGLGYGLDEAAKQALKTCRFYPAMIGLQAVITKITYTYTFIIED